MQNMNSIPRYKSLTLAAAVAVATLGLSACGGSSSSSDPSAPVGLQKAFNCTNDNTPGARVICIGSANNLGDRAVQDSLIGALAEAETGDTYVLPQGRYNFTNTIEFNGKVDNTVVSDLTFRGAGMDKTIINTHGASADGFLFNNTDNLVFEDFGIYESRNNALKVTKSDGVIMRRLATVWETDYQASNGAYGLYPVQTSNVLIEDCYVKGSADAGVYVGQSDKIVVRNNIAEKNVAGIEIENSTEADVYGNTAKGNTGGILIFDLPIGNGKYGSGVRIFDNVVEANNAPNFANVGTFAGGVHIVPPGTGVIVLSTSNVEIYNNIIKDHQTTSIAITSYLLPDDAVASPPNEDIGGADGDAATTPVMTYGDIHPYATMFLDGWSPLVRGINIHNNTISVAEGIYAPEGKLIEDLIAGYTAYGLQVPDILYDGIGELLANAGSMSQIAGGIDQLAAALDLNGLEDKGLQIPDLGVFADYGVTDHVCASNNGSINQTSVYPTTAAEATFDGTGAPEPVFVASNNSMACGGNTGFTPVTVPAATVTFKTQTYGCTTDDVNNASCAL